MVRYSRILLRPCQRSIDGLRFDTVHFALIEQRQPYSEDVVIATFSMIDELSEPNWKLCIRTSPSSPLHENHALIMATMMVLYRRSWTWMSAEAQMTANRKRVKASLEAASLSHAGYVNYQLDRSGEVKDMIIRRYRPAAAAATAQAAAGAADNTGSAQANAAATVEATAAAAQQALEERWNFCPPPFMPLTDSAASRNSRAVSAF